MGGRGGGEGIHVRVAGDHLELLVEALAADHEGLSEVLRAPGVLVCLREENMLVSRCRQEELELRQGDRELHGLVWFGLVYLQQDAGLVDGRSGSHLSFHLAAC